MQWSFIFFLNSILLGIGLAMDAFSVSVANGLNENKMSLARMNLMAGTFSLFQFAMPMIGWFCVHKIVELFTSFEKLVPWIALALLVYIGGEMLIKGIKQQGDFIEEEKKNLSSGKLVVQGIATSIDALSVGFTIEEYPASMALVAALIIGVITYFICLGGIVIGKKFGTKFSSEASILGGVILIAIGIEIFLRGIL
jgi:putative Mn2+ efflux pump MntP